MEKYFHEKNESLSSSDSERIRLTTERCFAADLCSLYAIVIKKKRRAFHKLMPLEQVMAAVNMRGNNMHRPC